MEVLLDEPELPHLEVITADFCPSKHDPFIWNADDTFYGVTINLPRTKELVAKTSWEQQEFYLYLINRMFKHHLHEKPCVFKKTFEFCNDRFVHIHMLLRFRDIIEPEVEVCNIAKCIYYACCTKKRQSQYLQKYYFFEYDRYKAPLCCVQLLHHKEEFWRWQTYMHKHCKVLKGLC